MVKIVDKQTSFNTGILTEKLKARTDIKQYDNGLSDAFNFFVTKYGPITKRTGTMFKWNTENVGKKVYLIPFIFNINQSVLLEFLDKKIRFYTFDGEEFGPIADAEDPSKQYELETPFGEDLLDKISYAQSLDVLYLAFSDGRTRPKELRRYANNNWKLVDYEFEDGPYLDMNYDQSKKVKFSELGPGEVTMETIGFSLGEEDIGRHIRVNHVEVDTLEDRWGWGVIKSITSTGQSTLSTGSVYKYSFVSADLFLESSNLNVAHIGEGYFYTTEKIPEGTISNNIQMYSDPDCTQQDGYIESRNVEKGYLWVREVKRVDGQSRYGAYNKVTLIDSTGGKVESTVVVELFQKVWDTAETPDFRLGAWSDAQGWPTLVTIHEQRLVWSGVTNYPWLWMSNSFNYNNFSPSDYNGNVKDSNAIYYNLATDKLAPVKWLASLGSLIIGTEGYEMRLYSAGAGLAPSDCVARKETTYGCHESLPVLIDDNLLFIQRLQRKVRSISYDYTRDAYIGPELSILAESLTAPGLKKMVHQREPNDIIWCLLEDGTLLALTYDREQSVQGWTRVEIAGNEARVIDLAVLPSSANKQDMLILCIERMINGETKRYLEVLCKEFSGNREIKDITYLDSSVRYQGGETTTISGLDHLEGEEVIVTYEGGLHEKLTVENGSVQFKYPITDGWIGLPYKAYFETLERDISDQTVSIKIARVRIHKLILYILKTLGLTVTQKTRGMTTQLITFSPLSNMDTPPELLSGEVEQDIMTSWTNNVDMKYTLRFESEPALPCTIAGIYAGVEINAL